MAWRKTRQHIITVRPYLGVGASRKETSTSTPTTTLTSMVCFVVAAVAVPLLCCYAMLCYAALCYALLCYAMLCF
eukprot:4437046-Pyramimonas_sp.AAC.1